MEDVCKLCNEKLDKKQGDALFYCMKCSDKVKQKEKIKELLG